MTDESSSDHKARPVGGMWWLVNTDGFPMSDKTWERMWDYVIHKHPQGRAVAESIRDKTTQAVPYPSVPHIHSLSLIPSSIVNIQNYMNKLQYNHTGTQFFDIKKYRPLSKLMEMAEQMIKESLPIKCLEAVVLSLYLTSPLASLQRFTIRFKSRYKSRWYRHVVLGLNHSGLYGALGLSRRSTLMYKPLQYQSLYDLVQDFLSAYEDLITIFNNHAECPLFETGHHEVLYIKLSSFISHNRQSCYPINWKFLVISVKDVGNDADLKRILDKHIRNSRTLSNIDC